MFHIHFPLNVCLSLENVIFERNYYSVTIFPQSASDHRYPDLYLGIFTSIFEASEQDGVALFLNNSRLRDRTSNKLVTSCLLHKLYDLGSLEMSESLYFISTFVMPCT